MYITCGINQAIEDDENFACEIAHAVSKFAHNDWGDTCQSDALLNNKALLNGDRIVALYKTSKAMFSSSQKLIEKSQQ
jgi:hypothetical protein